MSGSEWTVWWTTFCAPEKLAPKRRNGPAAFFRSMTSLRCFSRRKRMPLGRSSSCQAVDSQPYGVSFECRAYGRASANELPDPHFQVKQISFRVAASSANLPLEKTLLWRALETDRNSNSSVWSAPVQESHAALPSSRARGSESLPPEEV